MIRDVADEVAVICDGCGTEVRTGLAPDELYRKDGAPKAAAAQVLEELSIRQQGDRHLCARCADLRAGVEEVFVNGRSLTVDELALQAETDEDMAHRLREYDERKAAEA